jgi:hypothetical protein
MKLCIRLRANNFLIKIIELSEEYKKDFTGLQIPNLKMYVERFFTFNEIRTSTCFHTIFTANYKSW